MVIFKILMTILCVILGIAFSTAAWYRTERIIEKGHKIWSRIKSFLVCVFFICGMIFCFALIRFIWWGC